MLLSIAIVALLPSLVWPANAKLFINRLDQVDTNLVTPNDPPPQQSTPRLQRMQGNHWVKISDAPPLVVNTKLGQRIEIECEALGSPAPNIQWYRGDLPIHQGRKGQSVQSNTEKTGLAKWKSRLIIECVTRKHEGFYTCTSKAGDLTVKANPTLLLIDGIGHGDLDMCSSGQRFPPRIVEWAPTAMEPMGFDLRLPCTAIGSPAPTVYWLDPSNNVINSIRHRVSDNGDLTISRLIWDDMGEYTCVAESPEGRDATTTFVYPVLNDNN